MSSTFKLTSSALAGSLTHHEFPSLADYEAIVKLSEGFNGADLRNVCTEAGMFAIRYVSFSSLSLSLFPLSVDPNPSCGRNSDDRDYVQQDDFMRAARKLEESKKHEGDTSALYEKP